MLPYSLLFLLVLMLSWFRSRPVIIDNPWAHWPMTWRCMFVLLVLMIGLRHQVGGDWGRHLINLDIIAEASMAEALAIGLDPSNIILNWLATQWGGGVYFVNTVCAAIFAWGLVVYCRSMPLPWLALTVAVPYLVVVVAMGYTRQGGAIGLAMLGMVALGRGRVFRYVLWIALAASFHKSAVIMIPLAIFFGSGRTRLHSVLVAGVVLLLFRLLYELQLMDSLELPLMYSFKYLISTYLEYNIYQSSGAAIRVAMNALPAAVFLIFRNRFNLLPAQRGFWTWMALCGVAFVALLAISPSSSTAVDRVALYWIPLQLFVWSHLPVALGRPGRASLRWVRYIVIYSATVQFGWLFFAQTAFAWLPYQFYPLVALFQ